MARIQTGTQIEDKSVARAVTAKGYLGRAIMITDIWESTCVSFVSKVGYFTDDDVNEHHKRNLQPNNYVFTPVVRLCTSPQGDVVSPQCKVEFLRLSPNMYNKFCDDIRRNPSYTHIELVADSSGTFEKTVPVPVSTQLPFVPEIQAFIATLDVEALLTTIKAEMGSPLSVYDARLQAQDAGQQQGGQQFAQPGAQNGFQSNSGGQPFAQGAGAPAFQQPSGQGFQPAGQPFQASAFQGAPAFQQPPAQQPPAQVGQGVFQFPTFGGFVDNGQQGGS